MSEKNTVPSEENNCFAFKKKCTILVPSKLSAADKQKCGTMECPFYKPREHANSIKHIDDGVVTFETAEEFEQNTGIQMIRIGNEKEYKDYPHAETDELKDAFCEYIRTKRNFEDLSMADLREYAGYIGVPTGNMKKNELIECLRNFV